MSQVTKRALEQSLKNLLLKKPLTKITINDIADDCGINRMTFYYHLRIFMTWWNGPAWRMPSEPWTRIRLMKHGSRDFCRFLRRYRITSRLF